MQYIKAKFENSKRSYTYQTEDDVNKVGVVKKYVETESEVVNG